MGCFASTARATGFETSLYIHSSQENLSDTMNWHTEQQYFEND
jgi:hypothetical protein